MRKTIIVLLALTMVLCLTSFAMAWRYPTTTERNNAVNWAKTSGNISGCWTYVITVYWEGAHCTTDWYPDAWNAAQAIVPSYKLEAYPAVNGAFVFWDQGIHYNGHVGITEDGTWMWHSWGGVVSRTTFKDYHPEDYYGWEYIHVTN